MTNIEKTLSFLKKNQEETGEFKSFCCLPDNEPKEWRYSGDSPFVTANILFCLRNVKHGECLKIRENGLVYLKSLRENFGLWRYWKHNNGIMEYNVPADVDDSSLIAFLLEKRGDDVTCTLELVSANVSFRNRYYTWFLPRYQFLPSPRVFLWLWYELYKTAIVFLPNPKIPKYEPISSPWDSEHGVGAHAIMALGKRAQSSAITQMVKDVQQNDISLQYYDHKLFVYHHISRAFSEGVLGFSVLKNIILNTIQQFGITHDEQDEFYLLNVVNYITLKNYGLHHCAFGKELRGFLKSDPMVSKQKWRPYKYWTSKQRSWWAGSPELTAALYLEMLYD